MFTHAANIADWPFALKEYKFKASQTPNFYFSAIAAFEEKHPERCEKHLRISQGWTTRPQFLHRILR
jgi:hypothetical protein